MTRVTFFSHAPEERHWSTRTNELLRRKRKTKPSGRVEARTLGPCPRSSSSGAFLGLQRARPSRPILPCLHCGRSTGLPPRAKSIPTRLSPGSLLGVVWPGWKLSCSASSTRVREPRRFLAASVRAFVKRATRSDACFTCEHLVRRPRAQADF